MIDTFTLFTETKLTAGRARDIDDAIVQAREQAVREHFTHANFSHYTRNADKERVYHFELSR